MGSSFSGRTRIRRIASAVFPAILFACLILIRIPSQVSHTLSTYSLVLFLAAGLLYFAGFQLPKEYQWAATAGLTMTLFALTLSFLWSSGYSSDKVIAGLLPFRDAFDYFNGAHWILGGHFILNINEGAAWRPLYPGFLAALLWLTQGSLQWALAVQVAVAAICLSLAAMQVRSRWGSAAGALFAVLLSFYIQPLIGTAYTETLGLSLGCLGFVVLFEAVHAHRLTMLMAGVVILMLAISVRAGAFLIFPVLVLWVGWEWRAGRRYSVRIAGLALATVAVAYVVVNTAYSRLMVEPGGFAFGNFAFTFYGQVNGGAGYHKAFEDLGVRNPAVIMRAAERFFVAHPASFAVGAAKAYRDFFSPFWGVFSLGFSLGDVALSVVLTILLLVGLYRLVRQAIGPVASFLLAAFVGILFSVPFLPPIDGGIRIYASTMPFVYAVPALAMAAVLPPLPSESNGPSYSVPAAAFAGVLCFLIVLVPVAIRYLTPNPAATAPSCPVGQNPFVADVSVGSYVDLVPGGAGNCGRLPEVCLVDFERLSAGNDPSDIAVFDQIASAVDSSPVRVFAANNLIDGHPHLFVGPASALTVSGTTALAGCATETQIKGRPSLYAVQSITSIRAAP